MHIVEFFIIGEDMGPALHRAGAGARQVLALPQSPRAGAVGESISRRVYSGKRQASPCTPPQQWLSLPGAATGVEGLSRGISVATMGAMALLQGQAAQVSDVIQHSAWRKGQWLQMLPVQVTWGSLPPRQSQS